MGRLISSNTPVPPRLVLPRHLRPPELPQIPIALQHSCTQKGSDTHYNPTPILIAIVASNLRRYLRQSPSSTTAQPRHSETLYSKISIRGIPMVSKKECWLILTYMIHISGGNNNEHVCVVWWILACRKMPDVAKRRGTLRICGWG